MTSDAMSLLAFNKATVTRLGRFLPAMMAESDYQYTVSVHSIHSKSEVPSTTIRLQYGVRTYYGTELSVRVLVRTHINNKYSYEYAVLITYSVQVHSTYEYSNIQSTGTAKYSTVVQYLYSSQYSTSKVLLYLYSNLTTVIVLRCIRRLQ